MLRTWLEPHEISVPESFLQSIGGNPLVSRVLYQRGITGIDSARGFLFPEYYHPSSPSELPDAEKVAEMLQRSIKEK